MLQLDYNQFIGIPWKWKEHTLHGCDCWTFCCLIWERVFNWKAPEIDYDAAFENVFKEHFTDFFDFVTEPQLGDICVFHYKQPHMGIYIDDAVLHCLKKAGSVITPYSRCKRYIKLIGRPKFRK